MRWEGHCQIIFVCTAVLHLLYARFITHFLADIGLLECKEPFKKLLAQVNVCVWSDMQPPWPRALLPPYLCLFQGMVQSKTYRLHGSGQYLEPNEVEELVRQGRKEEMEVRWEKMSKSKHNGVEPADVVRRFGADTVRLFVLFKVTLSMATCSVCGDLFLLIVTGTS